MKKQTLLAVLWVLSIGTTLFAQTDLGDGRVVLDDPTVGPTRFVGMVYFDDPLGRKRADGTVKVQAGSGALIGPRHVLTASHVVWKTEFLSVGDKDGFPPPKIDIYFAPARNGTKEPFGRAKVVGIHFQKVYMEVTKQYESPDLLDAQRSDAGFLHTDRDLCVLLLDKEEAQEIYKKVKGHFSYRAPTKEMLDSINRVTRWRINGYDYHPEHWGKQITRSGIVVKNAGSVLGASGRTHPYHLFHAGGPAPEGASGGPVWSMIPRKGMAGDEPTVIGVVSNTFGRDKLVRGPMLDAQYEKWIEHYVTNNP